MTIRTRLALTAGTAVSVAASLLVATGSPAAAAAVPPWEPDPGSIGSLSFFDATGAVLTGGNVSDAPFAAYVKGSVAGRAGDTKATLFGYLPKNGVDVGAWTGEALTASTTYPNAAAPGGLGSTTLPVVSVTSADFTLATLVADLPNTAVDAYQGLYQLRLKTSGPGNPAGAEYQSADILISGGTWSQVYPEVVNTDCDGNSAFDFNGDGAGDLVVGEPGEDIGTTKANAGAVNIVYGSADGKTFGTNASAQLTEESVGLVSAANDRFGASVVSGDFDGTGCRDLVIGIPGKNGGAGQALVVFFDSNGVSGTQLLGPGVGGTAGTGVAGDGFGSALATSQGSDPAAGTLWVGSPGKDVGTAKDAGAVTIFHRTASGFDRAGATTLTQTSAGVPGNSVASDKFGGILADRGGSAGIIVGLPNKEVGTLVDAGQVFLAGPSGAPWSVVNQNTTGVPGTAEAGDLFGSAVAGFHSCTASPGTAEIIGAPGEDIGTTADAGIVTIVDLLGTSKDIPQGTGGVTGAAEASDHFGASIVVDHDGRLLVGVPGEDVGSPVLANAGLVEQAGLTCTVATKTWSIAWSSTLVEGSGGVPGTAQANDKFGTTLTARFDTAPDASEVRILAVGAPGEASTTKTAAGAVWVFPSWKTPATGGAVATGSSFFSEATAGIAGSAETSDGFGAALDRAAQ